MIASSDMPSKKEHYEKKVRQAKRMMEVNIDSILLKFGHIDDYTIIEVRQEDIVKHVENLYPFRKADIRPMTVEVAEKYRQHGWIVNTKPFMELTLGEALSAIWKDYVVIFYFSRVA